MADQTSTHIRPDQDIMADIPKAFSKYAPLRHDRSRVEVNVKNGAVTASGYVKTPLSRDMFVKSASQIRGVKSVNIDKLYDDTALRLDVAQVLPIGVYGNLEYGAVILTGQVPEETTAKKLAASVKKVKGVRAVLLNF